MKDGVSKDSVWQKIKKYKSRLDKSRTRAFRMRASRQEEETEGRDDEVSMGRSASIMSAKSSNTVRVIEPVRPVTRVQTEYTLAALVLGIRHRYERFAFSLVVKRSATSFLFVASWWTGVMLGMFSLLTAAPSKNLVWFSLLMLPWPCLGFWLLSVDLVKAVAMEFETYLVTALQIYVVVSAKRMMSDERIVFWICCIPSMIVASLADAYPSRFRRKFSISFFTGMLLIYFSWSLMITFGVCEPLHHSRWVFFELEGQLASGTVSSLLTLLAFCIRNLYAIIFTPDEFVIICSAVRTVKVEVIGSADSGELSLAKAKHWRVSLRQGDEEELDFTSMASEASCSSSSVCKEQAHASDKPDAEHEKLPFSPTAAILGATSEGKDLFKQATTQLFANRSSCLPICGPWSHSSHEASSFGSIFSSAPPASDQPASDAV